MTEALLTRGGAATAEPSPADLVEVDEFALDVRVFVTHGPMAGDCPTDDGCGNTCANDASACASDADSPV
ncbi:FxLD family lanthipeptide [Actinosynnema sp. NPDC050436]|uniref:FxLD family lanthipeptide n=1 Tax=Actinosynnema sp. NPDC050436 TaxID=3155659 RepID=UPI0033D78885